MVGDFEKREENTDLLAMNWVGKVNERCQKFRLPNPMYNVEEEGPGNQRTFTAICIVGNTETKAQAKTKRVKNPTSPILKQKLEKKNNENKSRFQKN
ncbi:unnamed protein product [Gongylonema pulchrum]|uniref:DRBM domain-containing protein n=1 Tax=Gongylonema pulchrum TaxID=637853 RepID=A0A183F182_9BILA|nr:unnamed protein product [Gongylonema pulchrum]